MSDPTPPAVSDAMREAVARVLWGPYDTGRQLDAICATFASEIARLTGERDAATNRADKLAEAWEAMNASRLEAYSYMTVAEAETARLREQMGQLRNGLTNSRAAEDDAVRLLSERAERYEAETARLRAALEAAIETETEQRERGNTWRTRAQNAEAALAEAEARGRRQGPAWQLMETAPKDEFRGEDFLGYLEDSMGGWLDLCCWSGQHQEFMPRQCLVDPTLWRKDCQTRGTRITRWMPLPSLATAPAETQKPETGESKP